jgi:hypothetical protein
MPLKNKKIQHQSLKNEMDPNLDLSKIEEIHILKEKIRKLEQL